MSSYADNDTTTTIETIDDFNTEISSPTADTESYRGTPERRLVVAIDYGTTYTGVAIATPEENAADLDNISVIKDWGNRMLNRDKIPSVISYSKATDVGERQWGADLSEEAIAMIHTKLELPLSGTSDELDLVLKTLEGVQDLHFSHIKSAGPLPEYPSRKPEDIVSDYIVRVFEVVLDRIAIEFTPEFRNATPVDVVITMPADWPYRARNSTFRALTQAGVGKDYFPKLQDIMTISEPEAAAIYTARWFAERPETRQFLKEKECFVLCDAGGGTVDVVSYKVNKVEPLELEKITIATSSKCGSSFIDLLFKKWLWNLIGRENYRILDPRSQNFNTGSHDMEGGMMRQFMKQFDNHKRKFKSDYRSMRVDLPGELVNLSIDGRVRSGEITITNELMRSFFDPQIHQIIEMIEGQIAKIHSKAGRRTKNVFLIGGFAESEYLQEQLRRSLHRRGIEARIPDTSWTAVVRGAAICGVEKTSFKMHTMKAWPRYYGVSVDEKFSIIKHQYKDRKFDPMTQTLVAKGQFMWLIKKGDLIISDPQMLPVEEYSFDFMFPETHERRGSIRIYSYDDDDAPDNLADSIGEVHVAKELKWNLRNYDLREFIYVQPTSRNKPAQYYAALHLKLELRGDDLEASLTWKNELLSFETIRNT